MRDMFVNYVHNISIKKKYIFNHYYFIYFYNYQVHYRYYIVHIYNVHCIEDVKLQTKLYMYSVC